MDKKYIFIMTIVVGIFIKLALRTFNYGLLYVSLFFAVGSLLIVIIGSLEWVKFEKGRKLGENLFLSKVGIKPDKVEVLSSHTYKYDHLNHGISTHSVRIKFWSQGKVFKGLVDMENEVLYIKAPVLLPVYTGGVIPVWEEVTAVHRNGMPKTVEFRDAAEQLHRVDYMDEEGMLKKFSWRRHKGIEMYWYPEKQAWEP